MKTEQRATETEIEKLPTVPNLEETKAPLTIKTLFAKDEVQSKFKEMLGKKSQGFITSVLQITANNSLLSKADPISIYNSACTAATLDLPINNNLGFAWIVPYKGAAQFQIGWKGFTQLALRTGQYLRLNVVEVYGNQFNGYNALTENLDADFEKDGAGEIVGYCAYFKLLNGFEKTVYWSKAKVTAHALKYSQAYKNGTQSPWKDKDQFHEMAKKTVLKNTLSKWGILSIEMQRALIVDQGVIKDSDTLDVDYIDNDREKVEIDHVKERVRAMLSDCKTIADLELLQESYPDLEIGLFNERREALNAAQ